MIRWFERTAESYLPYTSHLQPEVMLLADGSLLAVLRLHGLAHELSVESERRANANILNGIWQAIGDDNVTLGTHYIRRLQSPPIERPTFTNEFSEALDINYRERVLGDRLFANEWFVSLIVSPPNPFGGTEFGRQINRRLAWFRNGEAEPSERLVSQVEAALVTIGKSLSAYHVRRLGLRRGQRAWFSEIAELLHLLLTTVWMPVPLTNGPLGHAIYSDRVIFGHYLTKVLKYLIGDVGGCPRWAYEVQTATGSKFASILGLKQYMAETDVGILDALLSVPFSVVATQSFSLLSRSMAVSKLDLRKNQMAAAGDKARSQMQDLPDAQSRLMNGEFEMGSHHFSLAVYADNLDDLDDNIGLARARLAEAGAIAVPETLGMEGRLLGAIAGQSRLAHTAGDPIVAQFFAPRGLPGISGRLAKRALGRGCRALQDNGRHGLRLCAAHRRCRHDGHFWPHRLGQEHAADVSAGDVRPVHGRVPWHHRVLRQGSRR
jgi:type IV secretion system protein VirB4